MVERISQTEAPIIKKKNDNFDCIKIKNLYLLKYIIKSEKSALRMIISIAYITIKIFYAEYILNIPRNQ